MKTIVIVGGGFAGINCALALDKNLSKDERAEILLLDRRDYHLFTPNLYEIAAADEEFVSVDGLKKSIALPYEEIFQGTQVKFAQGEVSDMDIVNKTLKCGIRKISFDFLALTGGSESFDFGIDGAKEYALPLKTLKDALRIRNALSFAIERRKSENPLPVLRFVVAGGGYSGVETAGELSELSEILAWKYSYPIEKIEILVLEASNELVSGFDKRFSQDALARLKNLGVKVLLNAKICKIDQNLVYLLGGEAVHYDALVWTVGVKAVKLPVLDTLPMDARGRILADEHLKVKTKANIFIAGDVASVADSTGRPVVQTAQNAIHQGRFLGENIYRAMKNLPLKVYTPKTHGFIASVGGKWAILKYGNFYLTGIIAYLANKFAHFKYYWEVVGFWKAFKYIWLEWDVYGRND